MKNNSKPTFTEAFKKDVYLGLTSYPKYLLSKYIYDKPGDRLFQDIMDLPEYYLTETELQIFKRHGAEISEAFNATGSFDLIELGAGDGKKTKVLLKYLLNQKAEFTYLPVDISDNALDQLKKSVQKEIPEVKIEIQQGTYLETLEKLSKYNSRKKVIMVLGSNIGNLLHNDAIQFLKQIRLAMGPEDMLFIGFDQKKHPQTILDAYNDPQGVTAAFNKNSLMRINRELEGNFDPDNFLHWETYDPETGTARSFLVSTIEQKVAVGALGLDVHFEQWETIHTEISQKYDDHVVNWLAKEAGLKVTQTFTDDRKYYKNYIFRIKEDL